VHVPGVHPHQSGDDPLTEFHNWLSGELTSTLPQSIANNAIQLRGAASAAIGLVVLVAAPAEVAVVTAAAVGGFVWMAATWSSAATAAALEGAGSDILNQQPPDVPDFSNTMSILGNGYFEAALNSLLDVIAETGGQAGQTANTIVKTATNIVSAMDPGNQDGVTDETTTAAGENLFNVGSSTPLTGTWMGTYTRMPPSGCPSYSGLLSISTAEYSDGSYDGTVMMTNVTIYDSNCNVTEVGNVTDGGLIAGNTTVPDASGDLTFNGSIQWSLDNSLTSGDFTFTATLTNGSINGVFDNNGGTFDVH
jgi:hypothetical protein